MSDEISASKAASDPECPAVGDVVGGKFEVVRVLGSGGMGFVVAARNRSTDGLVAVKVLRSNAVKVEGVVQRFAREAKAAGSLQSPYIARVLDADLGADGLPYLVMELLDGRDLQQTLQRCGGKLPIAAACDVAIEVCAGLAEAHARGFVHRDLKPANIFLARTGAETIAKIVDFGISKKVGAEDEITKTMAAMGTPLYMSPEQVKDAKSVDHRSDIWSLGIVLYRMLTGELPFRGNATAAAIAIATTEPRPPRAIEPSIPEALERAVSTALQKDPAQRHASALDFARAIAPFATPKVAARALDDIARRTAGAEPVESIDLGAMSGEGPAATHIAVTGALVSVPDARPRRRTFAIAAIVGAVSLAAALVVATRPAKPPLPSPASTPASTPVPLAPSLSSSAPASATASASASGSTSASSKPMPTKPPTHVAPKKPVAPTNTLGVPL